jgi:hypothetical protein
MVSIAQFSQNAYACGSTKGRFNFGHVVSATNVFDNLHTDDDEGFACCLLREKSQRKVCTAGARHWQIMPQKIDSVLRLYSDVTKAETRHIHVTR